MKMFTIKPLVFGVIGLFSMGCEKDIEQADPFEFAVTKAFGTDPTSCEIIEFDNYDAQTNTVYHNGTPIRVNAQRHFFNGRLKSENAAFIFNTSNPTGKYSDFRTPSPAAMRSMGEILTLGVDRGQNTEVANEGGVIEMDFSSYGTINLKGLHVLDIEQSEANSSISLIGKDGKVFKTMLLPVTGAKGATRLRIDQTGVAKIQVTIKSNKKNKGSGAIDVIEFCPER